MRRSDLIVTLFQAPLVWHDAAANRAQFEQRMNHAGRSDVMVLPEMFASGFTMTPAQCAERMDGDTVHWMRARSKALGAVVCGSLVIEEDGRYYNRFLWATPDGGLQHYDKRHLFALAGEDEQYAAGARRVTIEYGGWRVVPMVCYDLRFPVWCRAAGDCDLMIFVANWPTPRRYAWTTLLRARAIENQCYVVGVNRTGRDANDKDYPGASAVLDPYGEPLVECGAEPLTISAALRAATLDQVRERLPFHRDADAFHLD